MLIRPILFRQLPQNKIDGFLHPIIDCVNVFPFQTVNSDAPLFSVLRIGEKIENVLFEVKSFAINI